MSNTIVDSVAIQALLDRIAGLDNDGGNPRYKKIVRRIVGDLFRTIEEFDINEDEFWHGLHYLQNATPEFGLIAPGLGFDHFLDIMMDAADQKSGIVGGTPRTIEGPLYVEDAPLSDSFADMGSNQPGEKMNLSGVIFDESGAPIANAIVDIWHASNTGGYSHFDPSLPEFMFRRRIRTGADGKYAVKSIVPSGYSVPEKGATEGILDGLGRHGSRPAHIHFFVRAEGYRHLTTQINIDGDPFLHDDFAFATRDELIATPSKDGELTKLSFDLTLLTASSTAQQAPSNRQRTVAGG
jgi:catechol 1,2-dioxygenase